MTEQTWTRDEVRAKLSKVLKDGEIETFMHGCGGDANDRIGYRDLHATVGEILGANFSLATNVMKEFGFEYAGRKPFARHLVNKIKTAVEEAG